jgi:phage terminase small subunit
MVKRVELKKHKPRLEAKQRIFVREYLSNGRSPTRAAQAAGYGGKNRNVLTVTGMEVYNKPEVRALIDQETPT